MRNISILMTFFVAMISAPALAADAVCISEDQEVQLVIKNADDIVNGHTAITQYYTIYDGVQSEIKNTAAIGFGQSKGSSNGVRWNYKYVDLVMSIPGPFGANIGRYTLSKDGKRQVQTEEAMFDCELSE